VERGLVGCDTVWRLQVDDCQRRLVVYFYDDFSVTRLYIVGDKVTSV
jgi:hypothetical protein